jgi:hypothetical protein
MHGASDDDVRDLWWWEGWLDTSLVEGRAAIFEWAAHMNSLSPELRVAVEVMLG